jgi:hypothetical protein
MILIVYWPSGHDEAIRARRCSDERYVLRSIGAVGRVEVAEILAFRVGDLNKHVDAALFDNDLNERVLFEGDVEGVRLTGAELAVDRRSELERLVLGVGDDG